MEKEAMGWMVEVAGAAKDGEPGAVRRYLVAIPSKRDALETVRRRMHVAAEDTVEAVNPLTRSDVYTTHRLMRGEVMKVD